MKSYLNEPKAERKSCSFKYTTKLRAHDGSTEDIVFKPSDAHQLVSVGVDKQLLLWDLRETSQPKLRLSNVHSKDINTVDWSKHDEHLLATGSNDTTVNLIDLRKPGIISTFYKHESKVAQVKFCDFDRRYLASSGDNLIFWDI